MWNPAINTPLRLRKLMKPTRRIFEPSWAVNLNLSRGLRFGNANVCTQMHINWLCSDWIAEFKSVQLMCQIVSTHMQHCSKESTPTPSPQGQLLSTSVPKKLRYLCRRYLTHAKHWTNDIQYDTMQDILSAPKRWQMLSLIRITETETEKL